MRRNDAQGIRGQAWGSGHSGVRCAAHLPTISQASDATVLRRRGGATAPLVAALTACLALAATLLFSASALAATAHIPAGSFSGSGGGDGELTAPGHAALESSTGNVFVADTDNGRVQVFAPDGAYLTQFGAAELDAPFGLAIREAGGQTLVYVSDPGTNQIVRYASDEQPTPSFTVDASFTTPASGSGADQVADFRSALAVAPNGDVWVADRGAGAVKRFDAAGAHVAGSNFDGSSSPGGSFDGLLDIATDSLGDVYVVDVDGDLENSPWSSQSRVLRFASDGAHRATLGDLHLPAAVAVDRATDRVAVAADQDAASQFAAPSLHVFDATGVKTSSLRMAGSASQSAVRGIAFGSSAGVIWSVNVPGSLFGTPQGQTGLHRFEETTLPEATIDPVDPSTVTETTAELSGTVTPQGDTTRARFELSSDGGSSWSGVSGDLPVCEVADPGDCAGGPQAVTFSASGLQHSTTYQVRLRALIGEGAASAVSPTTESFVTGAIDPPEVTIDAPTDVGLRSVEVAGTVDPNGFSAPYRFEYSRDEGSSWTAFDADEDGPEDAGAGTDPVDVSDEITGLASNTDYLLRLVASNPGGETASSPQAVTTLSAPPTVSTRRAGPTNRTMAYLNGAIEPNGLPTTYHFEYGADTGYGSRLPVVDEYAGTGDGRIDVSRQLGELAPGTTVHYRLVAKNADGVTVGEDRAFTTPATLDERGYELVSRADKGGAEVTAYPEPTVGGNNRAAAVGDRFVYAASAPTGIDVSGPATTNALATRTATGWTQQSLTAVESPTAGAPPIAFAWANDDLSKTVLRFLSPGPVPGAPEGEPNIYVRDTATGEHTLKTPVAPLVPTRPQGYSEVIAGSDDMSHVLIRTESGMSYTPDHVASNPGLYDLHDGEVRYVGYDEQNQPFTAADLPGVGPLSSAGLLPGTRPYMTSDGRVIVFVADGGIWVRIDGTTSRRISDPDDDVAGPAPSVEYVGLTQDDKAVLLRSHGPLTADGEAGIYRYDIESDSLTHVMPPAGVAGISADGRRIYYNGTGGIRLWDNGTDKLIGPDSTSAGEGYSSDVKVTPSGRFAVFGSGAQLTDQEHRGFALYLYDAETDELECTSCPSNGKPMEGAVSLYAYSGPIAYGLGRNLSDDGRYVFFTSAIFGADQSYHPADTNGRKDAYVYDSQRDQLDLLSTGKSSSDTYFVDASADGKTAYFTTREKLDARDFDSDRDVYAARIGGGFPAPPVPPAECGGTACQGQPSGRPSLAEAGSVSFAGPGNAAGRRGKVSVSKPRAVTGSVAALRVRVPARGRIRTSGSGLVGTSKTVRKAGTHRVRVRLSAPARRTLRRTHRVRVRVTVRFVADTGAAQSVRVLLTFKSKRPKGSR